MTDAQGTAAAIGLTGWVADCAMTAAAIEQRAAESPSPMAQHLLLGISDAFHGLGRAVDELILSADGTATQEEDMTKRDDEFLVWLRATQPDLAKKLMDQFAKNASEAAMSRAICGLPPAPSGPTIGDFVRLN